MTNDDKIQLDERETRQLTSREIAKIICGLLSSLVVWCDKEDVACRDTRFQIRHNEKS